MVRLSVVGAMFLLLMASVSLAQNQPFVAYFTYDPSGGAALTTTCNGSTPIPDGWIVKIFWDVDSDGADDTDPLATLCTVPPTCEDGPNGTVNFNQFTMNGTEQLDAAGYFIAPLNFTSYAISPSPARYYLRIYDTAGVNFYWTSAVKTLDPGMVEIWFQRAEWFCGASGPRCVVRDEHE
jgi:hypothetical protein